MTSASFDQDMGVEAAFLAQVTEALKGDHNDLRKEAIILRAFRAALAPLEAENARLREALEAIRLTGVYRDIKWAGMNAHDIARAALQDGV
jgi:hypothetical protein